MRSLVKATLVLALAVARTGANTQSSIPTAVIPLDLGDYELGRELTLLFSFAEADSICGPSKVQINGQNLHIDEDRSGHGTFLEDYGSEITARWTLECVEADGEPLEQKLVFTVEAVDGDPIDDISFEVHFRQAAPTAIIGFGGAAWDAQIIDGDDEYFKPTYWELFGDDVEYQEEDEADIARAEIDYLRRQRQEIDNRIADLHDFITESDPSELQCRTFWCWLMSIFNTLTGAASKSYKDIAHSNGFGRSHSGHKFPFPFPHHGHKHHHGNHTHGNHTRPHPPHKRPHWLPPFCRPPHHPPPKKPHHPKPHPPPEEPPKEPPETMPPHHPHQPYKPDPPTSPPEPDVPQTPEAPRPPQMPDAPAGASGTLVERPRPKVERPLGGSGNSQSPKHIKPQVLLQKGMSYTAQVSIEICIVALVLLAITGLIHRCATRRARRKQQVLRNALREYCRRVRSERRAARQEARRRRKEQFKAWFCNLFYRITGQLGDDEKHAACNEARAPLNDEEQQAPRPQQRERAESAASNTMEQDIAQFREVVGIVDNLLAGDRGTERTEAATLRTVSVHRDAGPVPPHMAPPPLPASSHPGYVNYPVYSRPPSPRNIPGAHHEHDLPPPPAYESEDEDTLVSTSVVTDGFRYMSGTDYTPSQGASSSSGADELGYNNKS